VNALRGHAAEFGLVAAKGLSKVETLLAAVAAEPAVPLLAREMIALLGRQIALVEQQVREVEARLLALHEANPVSRLLAGIPGVGPITAISLALGIDAGQFASGRHLAAWIGLVPRQRSSGGKPLLGGASAGPAMSGCASCWWSAPPR
jgi:transposase